jgi:hypothetical protein
MIDKKWIGHVLPPSVLPIELGRLKFFAKAIGERDPIYTESKAARAAGFRDVPAAPTFLFAAELDSKAIDTLLLTLEIPVERLLHGEQSFKYYGTACAGDTITVRSRIADIYQKKNGALEFVVKLSHATNQQDELIAEMRSILVCRN